MALAAVILLAGLNSACMAAVEIRGTVTEREHEFAKQVCGTRTKTKPAKCTTVPECWELEVEDSRGNVHEFCTDRATWETYEVGDNYPHIQH